MQRRNFLKNTAISSLGIQMSLGNIPVWAMAENRFSPLADEDDRVLVVVQMFGGNDALNTIIPADDDKYYAFRSSIGLKKADTFRLGNTRSYMNPALLTGVKQGLFGLYEEGKLAVIQGVGYPKPNLSHFRSTDIWLSATMPVNDSQILDSGWVGRMLKEKNTKITNDHPACMNIGNSTSLLFHSGTDDMAIAVENPTDFFERGKDILSGESVDSQATEYADEKNYLIDLSIKTNKFSSIVKTAFDTGKNSANFKESDKLSQQLKLVSRLISGGLKTKMYLVSIDGFDTHADQGSDYGKHKSLLSSVSEAISSFMEDLKLQNLSKNVIGMTVSEFGRRPEQNNSNGTDHGAAGVMFMFGDAVNGKVYGNPFSFDKLDSNKDFIHQFDYRQVYDELMIKWFNTGENTAQSILSGRFPLVEGGLLFGEKQKPLANEPTFNHESKLFPTPTSDGLVNIKFRLNKPSEVSVNEITSDGRSRQIMPFINLPAGEHDIPLLISVPKGIYFAQLIINGKAQNIKGMKI
jgi:uncharacterized protein (DUF1501 family)